MVSTEDCGSSNLSSILNIHLSIFYIDKNKLVWWKGIHSTLKKYPERMRVQISSLALCNIVFITIL